MFGLLLGIGTTIAAGISGLKELHYNDGAIKRGYKRYTDGSNPERIYYDARGAGRSLDDNQHIKIEHDYVTGDAWVMKGLPSQREKNLSAELREKFFLEKVKNPEPGRTVVNDCKSSGHWNNTDKYTYGYMYYCAGQWYKDLRTKRQYVIRRVGENGEPCLTPPLSSNKKFGEFYMDIQTRKLVRLSDDYIKLREKYKSKSYIKDDVAQQIIDLWNNRIDRENNNAVDYSKEYIMKEYYYNIYDVCPGEESLEERGRDRSINPC